MNIICCAIENDKPSARKENWFRYYHPIKRYFGAELLIAISDGPRETVGEYNRVDIKVMTYACGSVSLPFDPSMLNIVCFPVKLPARVDGWTYPRYWRSVWAAMNIGKALGAERVLEIETDAWVYTASMATRLANHRGFIGAPWCSEFTFPEMMLCCYPREVFQPVINFIGRKTWSQWSQPQPRPFENEIQHNFPIDLWYDTKGGRYCDSELSRDKRGSPPADADWSVQDEGITIEKWRA